MSEGKIKSLTQARAKHPFPWSYGANALGQITVLDAAGAPVALFDLLDLAVIVTQQVAAHETQPKPV